MAKTRPSPAATLQQLQTCTEQSPEDSNAWKALARHLMEAGDLDAARVAAQKANALVLDDAETCLLLGQIEFKAGDAMQAQRFFNDVLAVRPDCVDALQGLAAALAAREHNDEALTQVNAVLAQEPGRVAALSLKSKLLAKFGRLTEAVEICETLLRADPGNAAAHQVDLGNLWRDLGQFEQAEACYRKAIASPLQRTVALSNLLTLVHYMPNKSAADILHTCKGLGALFTPTRTPTRPRPADRSPQRILRVGMFSDGFCQHPVGSMTLTALEQLSGYGIEVYAYTTSSVVDAITERVMRLARKWTPISPLTDHAFADLLRDDGIDILIDLAGHHAGSRMLTVALEPAPIIIKWVGGLINTTGVKAFDYLITDSVESPPGSDSMYTEKLIRMPDDYICYVPPRRMPDVGALPALKNGYVTFGCFNNSTKLNEVVLAQWAQLMNSVPQSRLYLKSAPLGNAETQQQILDLMSRHGIDASRIRIEGRSNHYQLLECYNEVDIALDPWPYSGGLTTCEAMLMGVPVVTLPGPTFAGRHSATHLANAGMPELVVQDWEQYRERASGLASDLNALSTIRAHLRRILLESPVCDAAKFGRHLADALRAVWQRYCEGKPRAAMAFTPEGLPWFEDESAPTTVLHPEVEQDTFEFSFKGRIVAVDHGAVLISNDKLKSPSVRQALNVIAIDPAKAVSNPDAMLADGALRHYQAHVALGDGSPTTLQVCLDASLSSTLELSPASAQLPFLREGSNVLARLPLPTVRIDDIEGIDQVDWLILDDRHDTIKILDNAQRHLSRVLIVQARVMLPTVFADQPDLAALTQRLAQHGLRLLRLDNLSYRSYLPEDSLKSIAGSQVFSVDAVFVPTDEMLLTFDDNRRMKLAYLLHAVYQASDFAYHLLGLANPAIARRFLAQHEDMLAKRHNDATGLQLLDQGTQSDAPSIPHTLPDPLVVSLTSYPKRFKTLHLTLQCLIDQSVKPDRIILWIAYEDRSSLPASVRAFEQKGVEIRYCENIRSYKKIIPTLREENSSFIVTADDDIYFGRDWLEKLVRAWPHDYRTVVAWRAHTITLDPVSGMPLTYAQWQHANTSATTPSERVFPTSGAGVLYPPGVFHNDVLNEEKFLRLCPDADDIWLYSMCRLNGASFKTVGEPFYMRHWDGTQEEALWHKNLGENANDQSIANIVDHYGVFDTSLAKAPSPSSPHSNTAAFNSALYWSKRYESGGNSGAGSYGRLARFKADILNAFVDEFHIESVIEFGCGDGAQLQLATYPKYLGFDVAPESVRICRKLFAHDPTKQFKIVTEYAHERAELALSLDVIFHLIEDDVFDAYMHRLLNAALRYVVVYSSNHESRTPNSHVRHRKFTDWISRHYAGAFKLLQHIPNRYPMRDDPENESFADFFIFERIIEASKT